MVDTNNTQSNQSDSNSTDSNQQNNSGGTNFSGGGHKIVVGIDHGGGGHGYDDQTSMETVAKVLQECGNTVDVTQVGPNQETYLKGHGADIAVYLCNGVDAWTMWSFVSAIQAGSLPYTIFGMEGWYHNDDEPDGTLADMEHVRAEPFAVPHDGDKSDQGAMNASSNATTVGEYVDENSQYIGLCYAKTPEEMGQNICAGSCGGGGSLGNGSTGATAQIKDKTFEHCIRRICAATDSVFLVENNAAILFPYTDWMAYTLRQQINTITAKQMDPDLFSIEYNNEGFYNKVTTVYGADEETDDTAANSKNTDSKNAQSEEKITSGKTTKTKKSMPTGGVQISEQYDPLVKKYGELEKKVTTNFPDEETAQYVTNALLIQYIRDFNNSCKIRALHNTNFIGGTFYAVQNPFTKESDLFYLNSYVVHKDKDEPITVDMEFKYGPEGAEELLDYQAYVSGTSGGTGGASTSSTEEQIWADAAKCKWAQDQEDCSTNDPQTAKKHYDDYTAQGKQVHFDCFGMSAYLYYRFNYEANIPARVIGSTNHKVIELYKNNQWYKPIEEYRQLDELFRYDDDTSSPSSPVLLAPPNNPSSGSTNNTNSNTNNNS